jgi:hypothetical protein
MPNTHILLVECSPPSEWMDQLKSNVDQFINLEFNDLVNNSLDKGIGEKTLLLTALSNLTEEYSNIYKISGRYVLQNKIEWEPSEFPTFCKTNNYGMENGVHTFFYRIPNSKLSLFKEVLNSYEGGCIENFFSTKFENQINYIDRIGILVRWSCYDSTPIF